MKDLFRIVVIGLAAGACISARHAPDNEELAMARCSSDRCYPEQGRRYEKSKQQYAQDNQPRRKCSSNRNNSSSCSTVDASGRKKCAHPKGQVYDVEKQRNCDARGRCRETTDGTGSVHLRNNYKNVQTEDGVPVRKSAAQKVLEGY